MPRIRKLSVPIWKQVIALACAMYFLIAWAIPLFMLPVVNQLPFVHESDFYERLGLSVLFTTLVTVALVGMDHQKFWKIVRSQEPNRTQLEKLKHWVGVIAGLVMFTFTAAWLSTNSLGLIARILPSHPFSDTVILDSVKFEGSRYRTVVLSYKSQSDGKAHYLVLSKKLFEYPKFAVGNIVELQGESGLLGSYVTKFRIKG